MKFKYLIWSIICFVIFVFDANASSIEYNLTIDNDLSFHENNIYRVNSNELDRSGNYDFMTSVVTDTIYFNDNTKVPYTKTRSLSNGVYTVNLKHDYTSSFLVDSRILNECFNTFDFNDNETSLSIRTSSPFYCHARADSITINIITDLEVVSENADSINGNVYTWTPENENFTLRFNAQIPEVEVDPDAPTDFADEDGVDETNDGTNANDEETSNVDASEEDNDSSTSIVVIIIIVAVLIIAGIIAFVILRKKKEGLNKI